MVPSINLATDSLGLGQMYSSVFATKGTAECGSKPNCISFGKNSQCAQKNKAYQDCITKNLDVQSKSYDASISSNENQTKTALVSSENQTKIIIAVVVVIVVLAIILKRR